MESAYKLAEELGVVKVKSTNTWERVDVSTQTLQTLFQKYRKMEIAVDDVYGTAKTLLLSSYEPELRNRDITIAEWLVEVGNRTLVTLDGYPSLSFKTVSYVPMTYRDVNIQLAKPGWYPGHEAAIEDMNDVVVSYEGVEPKRLHEYGLWSYNGYFLPTTYHEYGVRIKHAGDIARKSGEVSGGFLNFEHVGKIHKVPITESMVFKMTEDMSYFDRLIIKSGGIPLFNKTIGIVIGGYLHLLDGSYKVISEDAISISLANLRYVERVLDSKDDLDLSFMGLDDVDQSAVVGHVRSDENILKYLTSQYSFLVIIENSEITIECEEVDNVDTFGRYHIPASQNMGMMVNHQGKNMEYFPTLENDIWTLHTNRYEENNPLFRQTHWFKDIRINDARVGSRITNPVSVKLVNFIARQK